MTRLPPLLAFGFWLSIFLIQSGFPTAGLALLVAVVGFSIWGCLKTGSYLVFLVWVVLWFASRLSQSVPGFSLVVSVLQGAGHSARGALAAQVVGISPGATALVLGLTDGDTSLLPKLLSEQLKALSLTHLNAVSGTNCSIIIAILLAVFARMALERWLRVALAAGALAAYLVLVGDQPSVLRAAVMALVMLAGMSQGFRFAPQNLLAVGVVTLLVLDPALATSLGLALSAAATYGVLVLAPRVENWLKKYLPAWLCVSIAVAFSAQMFCLPLLVSVQTNFSLLGLLANMMVEPIVPFITVLGVSGAAVGLVLPLLAQPLFWLASFGAQYIVWVAGQLSSSGPIISWPSQSAGVALAIVLLAGLIGATAQGPRWRRLGKYALALVLLALVPIQVGRLPSGNFPGKTWFYVACDVGQGDGTVIRSGSQIAVIDAGRDPKPIRDCLDRLSVRSIDLLVLTHFDLDHVGGLAGVLSGRRVGLALVTDYRDTRPGAQIAERQLQTRGVLVKHAALGMRGKLGAFSWLVLSPHRRGADSVDSNDGSISMFWSGAVASIFTMADLPASGQRRLMAERNQWWQPQFRRVPIILKLSHHGSADQEPAFLSWVHPEVSTISVGVGNAYGHPTRRALDWLSHDSALTLRTDELGSISLSTDSAGGLVWTASGAGSR